jgi:type III secretion system FlhB-like substrate exporter
VPDRAAVVRYATAAPREAAVADALARLRPEAELPEELWHSVAEVLVWAQRLDAAAR